MRILVMGPPGAGKGTQAARISQVLDVPAISTGDIFRANVTAGTDLGRSAQGFMNAGEYVPDHITDAMVRDRLAHDDCHGGFILDGYPRTLAQVKELDRILDDLDASIDTDHAADDRVDGGVGDGVGVGAGLDHVLALTAELDVLVARLLRRAEQEGRVDDTEPVIRRRQQVYLEQTAPLLDEYMARGLLTQIDGLGDVADVADRIAAILIDHQRRG